MAWTDERVQLLTKYWAEGHTASKIAELLGDGLSRNAVIGKAHRLGLPARPSPLKRDATDSKKKAKKPATKKAATKKATEKKAETPKAATKKAAAKPAAANKAEAPAEKPAAPVAEKTVKKVEKAPASPAVEPVAAKPAPAAPPPVRTAPEKRRRKNAKVTLLDLNDRICRWPLGHPDESDFHFCGKPVNPGFPYCPEHCLEAYQAQAPRRDKSKPMPPFRSNLPRPR